MLVFGLLVGRERTRGASCARGGTQSHALRFVLWTERKATGGSDRYFIHWGYRFPKCTMCPLHPSECGVQRDLLMVAIKVSGA